MSETRPADTVRRRLAAGDREGSYAEVVESTKDSLYRFLLHLLRDEDAARDVFQDTYVRVFGALEGFRGEAGITTWVLTIGRNLAFNRLRGRRLREDRARSLEAGMEIASPPAGDPATRSLLAAVADLPETQREAVLLFYGEDCPVAEVARVTGRPINTIKSDLWRARQHLRKRLECGR